jgi:hypothetical protein
VTLAWNSSSSSNIAGYRLHSGTTSGVYSQTIEVGNATSALVSSLMAGKTYFFAVTAYNTVGAESAASNEVSYLVPSSSATPTPTPPAAPTPTPSPSSTPTPIPAPSATPTPSASSTSGITAVSRKVHGLAETFDVSLPLTGASGIECRSGGTLGSHFIIVSFSDTVTSLGSVAITSGSGAIAASAFFGKQVGINLTGVRNAQAIIIRLSGVRLSHSSSTVTVSIPMAVLVGDTNGDGFVDAIDASQTKSQSGISVNTSNFREDVNIDGFIDTLDVSMVKAAGR